MIKTILSTLILATVSLTASAEYMVKIPLDVAINLNAGTETGVKTCDSWLPLPEDNLFGVSFEQTRNCTQNHQSIKGVDYVKETVEKQNATGTFSKYLSEPIVGTFNIIEFPTYLTNINDFYTSTHSVGPLTMIYYHKSLNRLDVNSGFSVTEANKIQAIRWIAGSNNVILNKIIQTSGHMSFQAAEVIDHASINTDTVYRIEFIYN